MDKRRVGVVLALIAAVVLGYGSLSRTWWTSTSADVRVGLNGGEMCIDGRCNQVSIQKLAAGDLRFARASAAAYWGGLLACLLLLITGVARLRVGVDSRRLSTITAVSVATAAAAGFGAVAWFPRMAGMAASHGMVVYFVGLALGAGACWLAWYKEGGADTASD